MARYQAFSCLERGYSHRNDCCQDYAGHYDNGTLQIAVVSDGHGDKSCFRSDVGSRFAVEVAMEQMKRFADSLRSLNWQSQLLDKKGRQEELMRQLKRSIVGAWDTRVREHLREEPLTQADLARQNRYSEVYRRGEKLTHIYGCTLIAAMILEDYLIVLHVGDGRCVVLHQDGTADQPVPWDPLCVGNVTTSLCHEDAADRCRHYVRSLKEDPIMGCFVTTDGIEDSFSDLPEQNGLCAYFSDVAARVGRSGIPALEAEMKEELPYISQYGSQDDTSFGAIVDLAAAEKLEGQLSLAFEMYKCRLEADTVQKKLNSMQRKMEILRGNVSAAQNGILAAEQECAQRESQLMDAEQELRSRNDRRPAMLEEQVRKITDRLSAWIGEAQVWLEDCRKRREDSVAKEEAARIKLAQAQKALEDYAQVHQSYVDQRSAAVEKLEALRKKAERLQQGLPVDAEAVYEPEVQEETPATVETEAPGAEQIPGGEEAASAEVREAPVQEGKPEEPVVPAQEQSLEEASPAEEPEDGEWEAPRAALAPEIVPEIAPEGENPEDPFGDSDMSV